MASALAAAALVALAFGMTRLFGGRVRACVVAALAVLASPLFLRTGTLFQPVVLDQLWWTLGFLALAWIGALAAAPRRRPPTAHAHGREPRRIPVEGRAWLALGAACGLGLLTKFSIVFLGVAVLAALVVGPLRGALLTVRPWLALAVALAVGAPSLVGQVRLGWPVLGQLRELRGTQLVHVGVLDFLGGQLLLGPALLLAVLGAWTLLAARGTRGARTAGLACVFAFALLLALRGKAYYAGPIYPLLFAAGAVALEQGTRGWRLRRAGATRRLAVAGALVVAYGLATLPVALPMLPVAATARWAAALGVDAVTRTNTGESLALPQDFADMLGWPALAAAVADAYAALPDSVRADVAVLAANYGQAGALDYYGWRVGLPPVVSPAGSYWFFGPGDRVADPVLTVGVPATSLFRRCARVVPLGIVRREESRWLVPEERNVPIHLCESPNPSLRAGWRNMRTQ
jgi:4-amino-4-deoxy-L-arabinose transferase-like glycosyltransferase